MKSAEQPCWLDTGSFMASDLVAAGFVKILLLEDDWDAETRVSLTEAGQAALDQARREDKMIEDGEMEDPFADD